MFAITQTMLDRLFISEWNYEHKQAILSYKRNICEKNKIISERFKPQ